MSPNDNSERAREAAVLETSRRRSVGTVQQGQHCVRLRAFYGVRLYKADNISQINTFLRRLIFPLNRMRCGAGGEGKRGLGNLLQY